jgi:hypothetical protein
VRFPVIFIRPYLDDQFCAAVDAMTLSAGETEPHTDNGDIQLLPLSVMGYKRASLLEYWDTLLVGWPGVPGSDAWDEAEEPSETLAGERFIRQPRVPPLDELHRRLVHYAVSGWSKARDAYREEDDVKAAARHLVPPATVLVRWTKDLQIAPAEPFTREVPKASASSRVGATELEQAIAIVWRRAQRKGIVLSQKHVRQQVRAAGGRGTDAVISRAWKAFVADPPID